MGGKASKPIDNCENYKNQIRELQDKILQEKLKKSKSTYNPENDNNILLARVGGGKRKKRSVKNKNQAKKTKKNRGL